MSNEVQLVGGRMENGSSNGKPADNTIVKANHKIYNEIEYSAKTESETNTSGSCFESEKQRLKKILKKKQHERALELTKLQSSYKLNAQSQKIVDLDWNTLVNSLQKRELTATEVLEAYIAKALDANSKFNNVTDFIPQAHAWAKELDNLKEVKGPLHGIPICVKDDTNVEGMDTTHGFVKRLYKPAKESSVIVKILQDLGAVPFCKTNVPQTLFTYGSDNPVFGTTTSAVNPKLSAGGSSSGTGSLVGSGGCMFGTGTDIGGSLRIPAHFSGVSSIKPTQGRVSDKGVESSLPNLVGLIPSVGIIGQTPTIVASVMEHLVEPKRQSSYDPMVYPVSWDEQTHNSTKKLRIGYFTSVPFFPPVGDTEDVVLEAKVALESLGHTLVPFTLPDSFDYMKTFAKFLLADQCKYFKKCWKGEDIAQSVFLLWLGSKLPVWAQKILRVIIGSKVVPFIHSTRTAAMFGAGACSSADLWDANGEKSAILHQILNDWKRLELDTLICPVFPMPAPPTNVPGLLPTAVCYCCIWNLVDFPAGVIPFGHESGKKIDSYNDQDDMSLREAKKATKQSVGSPINVQVVGLPFKEEIVLRVMKELEQYKQKLQQ